MAIRQDTPRLVPNSLSLADGKDALGNLCDFLDVCRFQDGNKWLQGKIQHVFSDGTCGIRAALKKTFYVPKGVVTPHMPSGFGRSSVFVD